MSTAQQLQKALEERAKEIEQLQNKLERAAADRQRWETQKRQFESKQPADVQALTSQKRELQMQLQREESEKQELFMQINKLIGEVAELQVKAENSDLTGKIGQLEAELHQLTVENSQLKSKAETAQQKLVASLQEQQQKLERLQKTHESELNRANLELRKSQKEIEVKDAALQSLKLARPSSKEDSLEREVEKLGTELARCSQENAKLLTQKVELDQVKSNLTDELLQLRQQVADQQKKLQHSSQAEDKLLEVFEHVGVPSTGGVGALKHKVDSFKNDISDEITRRKKLETELNQLRQTFDLSNTAREELARQIEELRDENERLTEKASVEEELHTLMQSLREAKAEVTAKETEATNWRHKMLQLEERFDQLQSDLNRKVVALQKAEHELHSLRSAAVENDILSKLELELHDAKQDAETQRQKLREALASRECSDLELAERCKELSELKDQIASMNTKLKESEVQRTQSDQQRVEELRRLKDDHRTKIEHVKREFSNEKERIIDRATSAEANAQNAHEEAEKTRQSIEEAQKRLASALKCSADFDTMLTTINKNQRRFDELQGQLEASNANWHTLEAQLLSEVSSLKSRESELQSALLASEQRLEEQVEEAKERQMQLSLEKEQLLESDRDELNRMNAELRDRCREQQQQHDKEMRNMRDEMIENIRRLSDLLEAETKRLQVANSERDRWLNEANRLESECARLRKQLDTNNTPSTTADNVETVELRAKVVELMDENVKLAGDLLKMESANADSAAQNELRQAQRHFNEEQLRWKQERSELEAQIQDLKQMPNGATTNGISSSLNGNPTPKPRKLNGNGLMPATSLSNLNSELSTVNEIPSGDDGDDTTKMKSELEKQKRLINVLRKKLQHQQIERVQQSRSFCTS